MFEKRLLSIIKKPHRHERQVHLIDIVQHSNQFSLIHYRAFKHRDMIPGKRGQLTYLDK